MQFLIAQDLALELLAYLTRQPHGEVENMVARLRTLPPVPPPALVAAEPAPPPPAPEHTEATK